MPPNIVAQIQQQQQLGGQLAFSAPAAFPSRVGLQKYKSRHLLRSCYLENNVPSSAFLEGLSTLAFCLEGSLCLCPWKPSQQSDAHLPSFCSYPLVMTHRITVPNRPGKIWTWNWLWFLAPRTEISGRGHLCRASSPGRMSFLISLIPGLSTLPTKSSRRSQIL